MTAPNDPSTAPDVRVRAMSRTVTGARTTQRDIRMRNRALVLAKLYFGGPRSRKELTKLTGLSTGAMTGLVGELMAEGVLEEAGLVSSDGGRPRMLMRVVTDHRLVIGVDIGESRVRVGLFTLDLDCLDVHGVDIGPDELVPERVVEIIITAVRLVMRRNKATWSRILGVGVGMLGIVENGAEDAIVHVPTVGWHAVPIGRMLSTLRAPVYVDNGARTLGQAEMWFGAGVGARSAAVVLHGNGVGAAFITHGANGVDVGSAIEWGHTVVEYDGALCRCGARGCLEAYIGAETLIERYREAAPGRVESDANPEEAIVQLLDDESSPAARAIVDEAAARFGRSLGGLINALRPERILLGGYAGAALGKVALGRIREVAVGSALDPLGRGVEIELCRYGKHGVMTGAAALPVSAWLERGAGSDPRAR